MLQKLKNILHFFESLFGAVIFGFPGRKLKVIGVTGTDGKTTTVNLIHHILTTAGYKTGISSTLSSVHTTTPGRWRLQKFLRQCLDNGCTHVVLEVSSIAIDQHRTWGIDFVIGVLTNIANNEHLDYHGSFENYRDIKIKFLKNCKKIVANGDDPSVTFLNGAVFYTIKDWGKYDYETQLIGDFNRMNILAATTVAREMGISQDVIAKAVASFESPSGRLEFVVKKPFSVIVDFAHTPQAFEKVLLEIKKTCLPAGRLIHVFGCTGDRDKSKRPIMGEIASKFDDVIILTHEDTYSEDPKKIISEIATGVTKEHLEILDRKEAIKQALGMAKSGDVVLITGVGHQKSLNIGGKEVPWSDQKVVKELMKKKK